MKKENGITLITLTITIIVLTILASVTTYTGLHTIRESKFTRFEQELEIVQAEVNVLYEKYKDSESIDIGRELTSEEADFAMAAFSAAGVADAEKANYKVFDEGVLESLDIQGIENVFLVNVKERKVISLVPFPFEGDNYYTLDQIRKIPNTGGLIRNENVTIEDVEYVKNGSGYTITLKNIQCSKYVGKYTIKYKEYNDSVYKTAVVGGTGVNYSFDVDKYGLYYIQITDAAGQTTERTEMLVSVYGGTKFTDETRIKMVKNITDSTITIEEVVIPAGFTISGVASECAQTTLGVIESNEKRYTIDDGVVCYLIKGNNTVDWSNATKVETAQKTYDQFVWVPVPNPVASSDAELTTMMSEGKYPMAVATSGTDSNGLLNYRGALYDFALSSDGTKVEITAKSWSLDSTANREPTYLTNSIYADASDYNTVGITEESLQEEYNVMVKKIATNKGFWVGRYETSNMVGTATTFGSHVLNKATVEADTTNRVTVIRGTTIGISSDFNIPNYINWYRMYAQQKNYSKLALGSITTVTSSMIWGSQWDQIMIWMKNVKNERVTTNGNYFVTNSVGYGNYGSISGAEVYDTATETDSPAATGFSDYFKVKNVYDLAGNVLDWSLEADGTNGRVIRGGLCYRSNSSDTRVDIRNGYQPCSSDGYYGSRATLY